METGLGAFLYHALTKLREAGITVILSAEKQVNFEGSDCSGYFDNRVNTLAVATGRKDWIDIFTHEYCHFIQWQRGDFKDLLEDEALLDNWYHRKVDISDDEAWKLTQKHRDVELDCEKKTVSMIDTWNLPIDKADYVRAANAYVLMYNLCYEMRAWMKKGPYDVPELMALLPAHWLDDYNTVSDEFRRIALRECF